MQKLSVIEQAVLNRIPKGNERKIAIREISRLIDLDERSVYEVINRLRKKGVPICATRNGLPSNDISSQRPKRNVQKG